MNLHVRSLWSAFNIDPMHTVLELATALICDRVQICVGEATRRWVAATGRPAEEFEDACRAFATSARITVNFHPDRLDNRGRTVAQGLRHDGRYVSQWVTGVSSGSRSAIRGGERERFERDLFGDVYAYADPHTIEFPIYGALDNERDPFGGSPRFGSSYLVLRPGTHRRVTLCMGDSHAGPADVGTFDSPALVVAGLAEQPRRRERSPARELDGYIEAQIHGGVDLSTDVEMVVFDPSFLGTSIEDELVAAGFEYGFAVACHEGSVLDPVTIDDEFRGSLVRPLALKIARADGLIDVRCLGTYAATLGPAALPTPDGDTPDSPLQLVKYLWHTLVAYGHPWHPSERESPVDT